MKSSSESASKGSLGLLILSSEKKLYWRPDGSNNRTEWIENFTHVFRGAVSYTHLTLPTIYSV